MIDGEQVSHYRVKGGKTRGQRENGESWEDGEEWGWRDGVMVR